MAAATEAVVHRPNDLPRTSVCSASAAAPTMPDDRIGGPNCRRRHRSGRGAPLKPLPLAPPELLLQRLLQVDLLEQSVQRPWARCALSSEPFRFSSAGNDRLRKLLERPIQRQAEAPCERVEMEVAGEDVQRFWPEPTIETRKRSARALDRPLHPVVCEQGCHSAPGGRLL